MNCEHCGQPATREEAGALLCACGATREQKPPPRDVYRTTVVNGSVGAIGPGARSYNTTIISSNIGPGAVVGAGAQGAGSVRAGRSISGMGSSAGTVSDTTISGMGLHIKKAVRCKVSGMSITIDEAIDCTFSGMSITVGRANRGCRVTGMNITVKEWVR